MRGKAFSSFANGINTGITPAYAGKRDREIVAVFVVRDHPRLCGEKHLTASPCSGSLGSPPPMRGKVIMSLNPVGLIGITPAYAGKRHGNFRGC